MSSNWDKERTICWECSKACGGCSWSERFEPVEGWDAVPTVDKAGNESFLVRKCPEFVKEDREKKRNAQALDTDGCMALVEKMLDIARDDYIEGDDNVQHQIERFLRGKGASKVHMISEPDAVIRKLKAASEEYRRRHEADDLIKELENELEQVVNWISSMNLYLDTIKRTVDFLGQRKARKACVDRFRNKICPRCGAILRGYGRYCSECGQEIKTNE